MDSGSAVLGNCRSYVSVAETLSTRSCLVFGVGQGGDEAVEGKASHGWRGKIGPSVTTAENLQG